MDVRREPDAAASPTGPGRRGFSLRTLLLLVGVCAAVAWSVRVVRDAAVPSYRRLHLLADGDVEQRRQAASSLDEVDGPIGATIRPRIAHALAAALGDPDEGVAVAAARSLVPVIQAEPDVELARAWSSALATGLRDPRVELRRATAVGLGIPSRGKASAAASDALAAALEDPDEEVRIAAAQALGHAGSGARGLAALAKALEHAPSTAVRLAAAGSLGTYRDGRDVATLALLRGLASGRPEVRAASEAALLRLHDEPRPPSAAIVPALIAATADADPAARACAAIALGDVGPEAVAAVPALIALLDDPEPPPAGGRRAGVGTRDRPRDPACRAAEALGRVAAGTDREAEAARALSAALARSSDDPPRRLAFAMSLSGFSAPFASEAVRPLAELLNGRALLGFDAPESDVIGVCEALGRLAPGSPGEAEAVEALAQAIGRGRSHAAIPAAVALERMGPRARAALPRLRELRGVAYESAPTLPRHVEAAIRSVERGTASGPP